jgi:lysophospholipase L1-like esterase
MRFSLLLVGLCLASLAPAATPTIFVVGDSTANNSNHRGWGDPVDSYFDPAKVQVLNRARGGRSSRTFISEGLWDKVLAELKPGDTVLLQFGHNDSGAPDKPKFRASLPGLGDETLDVTLENGTKETVHTFGWNMRKMVTDAKAKGAQVILLSPTVRNIWKDGKVESAVGKYGEWTAAIARETSTTFYDLSPVIAARYQEMGPERSPYSSRKTTPTPARKARISTLPSLSPDSRAFRNRRSSPCFRTKAAPSNPGLPCNPPTALR